MPTGCFGAKLASLLITKGYHLKKYSTSIGWHLGMKMVQDIRQH